MPQMTNHLFDTENGCGCLTIPLVIILLLLCIKVLCQTSEKMNIEIQNKVEQQKGN